MGAVSKTEDHYDHGCHWGKKFPVLPLGGVRTHKDWLAGAWVTLSLRSRARLEGSLHMVIGLRFSGPFQSTYS